MKVIGIAGKAESGKSSFASILKEELEGQGKKVLLINYGDFVKFIAEHLRFAYTIVAKAENTGFIRLK